MFLDINTQFDNFYNTSRDGRQSLILYLHLHLHLYLYLRVQAEVQAASI